MSARALITRWRKRFHEAEVVRTRPTDMFTVRNFVSPEGERARPDDLLNAGISIQRRVIASAPWAR